jgi:nitrogen regulatory protein PII
VYSPEKETGVMRKIEAIVHSDRLDVLHKAFLEAGIYKMTAMEVKDFGNHKEHVEIYRSDAYPVDSLARVKVEIIVPQNKVSTVVSLLSTKAQAGKSSEDNIVISSVNDVSRPFSNEKEESV